MGDRALIPRDFYDRPVLEVAPDLLGAVLVGNGLAVRLTEVEAYDGPNDPGSHAYRGRTPRTEVMFGPPGHAYVYFTYGMHWCMNLVCGPAGQASAVLLRAGEFVAVDSEVPDPEGLAAERRSGVRFVDLARGPARLTKLLDVDRRFDGADVTVDGPLRVLRGAPPDAGRVRSGPRVGLSAGAERPWRFWLEGEPTVSPYRPGKPRRRTANVPGVT